MIRLRIVALVAGLLTHTSYAAAEWRVEEMTDKFSDVKRYSMLTVDPKSPKTGSLALVCEIGTYGDPDLAAYISQSRYLGSQDSSVPVDYIFGESEPVDGYWTVWGKNLVRNRLWLNVKKKPPFLKPDRFLAGLLGEGILSVRVRDFSMESQDNEFDLAGFREAFSDFAEQCYSGRPKTLDAIRSYSKFLAGDELSRDEVDAVQD